MRFIRKIIREIVHEEARFFSGYVRADFLGAKLDLKALIEKEKITKPVISKLNPSARYVLGCALLEQTPSFTKSQIDTGILTPQVMSNALKDLKEAGYISQIEGKKKVWKTNI